MKTPEDEAFEEIERKQSGGFPAKRAMAKVRVEEDDDIQDYKRPWVGLTDEERESIAQDYSLTGFGYQSPFKAIEAKLKEKNT